jgi:membrane protein DedA with SNARE-associated domain
MDLQIFSSVTAWYMEHMNYGTITLLMAIESSFIPFPSEIVVPPAAYKAASGELSLPLVMLSASVGALIGALFNYWFALKLGRTVIYRLADTRLAHALLINLEGVQKAEGFFLKYGRSSTFVGRLVPGIRQLISLPAGLARMPLRTFLLFTTLGATLWNIILGLMGYYLYGQKELLQKYYGELSMGLLALGALFVLFLAYNGLKGRRSPTQVASSGN